MIPFKSHNRFCTHHPLASRKDFRRVKTTVCNVTFPLTDGGSSPRFSEACRLDGNVHMSLFHTPSRNLYGSHSHPILVANRKRPKHRTSGGVVEGQRLVARVELVGISDSLNGIRSNVSAASRKF